MFIFGALYRFRYCPIHHPTRCHLTFVFRNWYIGAHHRMCAVGHGLYDRMAIIDVLYVWYQMEQGARGCTQVTRWVQWARQIPSASQLMVYIRAVGMSTPAIVIVWSIFLTEVNFSWTARSRTLRRQGVNDRFSWSVKALLDFWPDLRLICCLTIHVATWLYLKKSKRRTFGKSFGHWTAS